MKFGQLNRIRICKSAPIIPLQAASFYGFRLKTVRSPSQNRMFLVRKPYGFGTENVKGRLLEADSIPFGNTLIHSLLNKFIE